MNFNFLSATKNLSRNLMLFQTIIKSPKSYLRKDILCYLSGMLIVAFSPISSFGQEAYISTKESKISGINILDGGNSINSRICQVKKGEEIITYTPYEVEEYGFKNGKKYISRVIETADSTQKVFLEFLHEGPTSLYYYAGKNIKTFFIEKDNAMLIAIPKKNTLNENYSFQLTHHLKDCSNVLEAAKLVDYNKKSFSKLIEAYNKCEYTTIPRLRYGFLIGLEALKIVPVLLETGIEFTDIFERYFDYKYEGSITFGLFLNKPINAGNYSFQTELLYAKYEYSYEQTFTNKNHVKLDADFSSLTVPLLFRYTHPAQRFRPYLNAGFSGTYLLKNEFQLYDTETFISREITASAIKLGYIMGGGLEFKVSSRNSILFDLRYKMQYDTGTSDFIGQSGISLHTGINF